MQKYLAEKKEYVIIGGSGENPISPELLHMIPKSVPYSLGRRAFL
jgi:hypothetical protein